ncbi:MAG: uroporphyrinogen decarboxylase family protein [Desulfobacterales bacterium]
MKSRERVLTALNHEEPDRVPVDCGGRQTTFMVDSYKNVKTHLGLKDLPTKMMSHKWQTVYVDEQILERFGIDCRHVRPPMIAEPELLESAAGEILFVADLVQFVRELTPARIYFHSCGAFAALLDDLIDIGVEILNPVQVTATGMETEKLKKRYGKQLSFWGAIDTTVVLPNGTAADVKKEVAKRIRDLGPGGGYVLGSVHNMQNDIPPQNILAMFEAAAQFGKYPLNAYVND